jgi:hypothetical protein
VVQMLMCDARSERVCRGFYVLSAVEGERARRDLR